ncbi:trypsin-like peptidase domain-containing protein [Clostridium sp. YIM B02505]|uniref:Trypsin-like peptidase domain-containing protein n=1 Tax=Clostridium yunnanense TaxID=2800325 RepID=A0ABS1ES51_9CLOT|nr:trypsin-like peptidase domain-containing protein [Clostridium yunnanense]MBK1812150.1 trypsin-like peptidase domain-containing protein [Clostridium yunnanense]
MNKTPIKNFAAKVFVNEEQNGSAFLISKDTALTARHVVNIDGVKEISFPNLDIIKPIKINEVIPSEVENLDVAILKFDPIEQDDIDFPKIYALLPNINEQYQSYGFPQSRADGCLFGGKIIDTRKNYTQVNLDLSVNRNICYKGASGSPLFIDEGVYGLIIEQDTGNELGSISFSECIEFLNEKNISYEQLEPLFKWEEQILDKMISLGKIGFDDNENLPYIETKATRCVLKELYTESKKYDYGKYDLKDIADEFFAQEHENNYNKILYVVADFGKGKSVFLKHEAAKHASKYIETRSGYFPIYFNLREYKSYGDNTASTGCIGEFLRREYNINIDNTVEEHPIRKKHILLLVDSLDECGSIEERDLMNVMASVKRFIRYFSDIKAIVTTRPIPNVIDKLIKENESYKNTWEFASVYGFTPQQFEQYMFALRDKLTKSSAYSYNQDLIDAIKSDENIYKKFSEILNEDELKRPIMAYMLFKLLEQDYQIQKDSKLEVFLSFINMLTKDAKHINDRDKLNSTQEYIQHLSYRNLLYVTAVMWMQDRHKNGAGFLKLDDLKRVVGDESTLIQFMSHSYLRNDNDMYYFNHQSFAEIILAEYYVRVFIWACMEGKSVCDTMALLNIGNPTPQTMMFCNGLMKLFIGSTDKLDNYNETELKRIRKSIFPPIASLGVEKFNGRLSDDKATSSKLYMYSEKIDKLFKVNELNGYIDIPDEILNNWPISVGDFEKIIDMCIEIINYDENILFFKPELVETLFGSVYKIGRRTQEFNIDISRWIAVLVLGVISTCNKKVDYRFQDIKPERFIEMMKLSQLESKFACPDWIYVLPELRFNLNIDYDLGSLKFFNKQIKNWYLGGSNLSSSEFTNVKIEKLCLYKMAFLGARFEEITGKNIELRAANGKGSVFRGCYIDNFVIESCSMEGAVIHESQIINCSFENVDFRGAELTAIWLIDVKKFDKVILQGCKISIWTDQKSYNILKKGIDSHKWRYIRVLSDAEVDEVRQRIYENTANFKGI